MATKIRWVNESPGASRDEAGYWRSLEGRFGISPNYRHTVNPDSYTVVDNMIRESRSGMMAKAKLNADTVRACKEWAQSRIDDEIAKAIR